MAEQHNQEQLRSSDPTKSVWASASAGTGKTKVLTDRVLKLLLSGTSPQKILCLTFTKAAAGEMLERINHTLISWTKASASELEDSLLSIFGRPPTNDEKIIAQSLFHISLKSAKQAQIQTIHSFCQSILRQFPFEAGITPGFQVIDEPKSYDLIRRVSHSIFANIDSSKGFDQETLNALTFMETNIHDSSLEELQNEIISSKVEFKILIDQFKTQENYEKFLKKTMQITQSADDYFATLFSTLDKYGALSLSQDELDNNIIQQYNDYYNLDKEGRKKSFDSVKNLFLTLLDVPRLKIISSKTAKTHPELLEVIQAIQSAILETDQALKALRLIQASKYLFILASQLITTYEEYKNKLGYIDYDDLIYLTQRLLGNSEYKEWILYKLDGGIEHILIDEAQDTSPAQWRIIEAIMQEFYSGNETSQNRTIFVVGDEKQSIYSFQGADIKAFNNMKTYLAKQMSDSRRSFEIVELAYGYRSTTAIIDFVHKVFNKLSDRFPTHANIKCFRSNHPGKVEIWPLITSEEKTNLFWPVFTKNQQISPSQELANNIAAYIKAEIASGKILPSTGKPISAGDFMILIRRRNNATTEIITALQDQGLEVAGIDRLIIADSLVAKDLISLAKFVLQPLDNLNLATLLKSPFIGINDDELQTLILSDKKQSIWHNLHTSKWGEIYKKLEQFKQLYLTYSLQDFFHIILNILGYRKQLLDFNGEESLDIINEFLELTNSFAKEISNNLQEFVLWFEHNPTEIKRNIEKNNKIRIMTIHGAKGLQAGVVILADTTSTPINQNSITWTPDHLALWGASSLNTNNYLSAIKIYNQSTDYEEYLRLLYVAMTRAEDHLIVTGYSNKKDAPKNSWYQIIMDNMVEVGYSETEYPFLRSPALIYHNHGKTPIAKPEAKNAIISLPPPPVISDPIIKHTEVRMTKGANPLKSNEGLLFGSIFHKVMEDMIRSQDFTLARNHPMLRLLPQRQQSFISNKIKTLIEKPDFKDLLGLEIHNEISLGLKESNNMRIGRIDLMAIDKRQITIIDYKTDKKSNLNEVPTEYIEQLAFYKKAISQIYPQHKVITKILWLETLELQEV